MTLLVLVKSTYQQVLVRQVPELQKEESETKSMQKPQYVEGWFVPSEGGGEGPVDPGWGVGKPPNKPGHPLPLPPLPGIWPKPGEPSLPIALPPGLWPPGDHGPGVMPPIYIPEEPTKPLPLPPGSIWPPLPPDLGLTGKVAILVWVVGVGFRWFIYDQAQVTPPIQLPGVPTPK